MKMCIKYENEVFRNMKRLFVAFMSIIMLTLTFSTSVSAAVMTYEEQNLELEIPDTTLIMTKDTPSNDPVWAKAGITDVAGKLEDMEDMNMLAVFFDTETRTTVNFMQKQSSETLEVFDFISMSEAEFIEYIGNMTSSTDDTSVVTTEKYEHPQSPFMRMQISVNTIGSEAREIIYATMINGEMLSFDIYKTGMVEIDETFVKKLVDSVHFTKIMTKAEYDEKIKESSMRLIILFIVVVALIVGVVFIFKYRGKQRKLRTKRISTQMLEFREKKKLGKLDNTVKFLNDTIYDDNIIGAFCLFHIWMKDIVKYVIGGIFVVISVILMLTSDSMIYCLLVVALVVVYVYQKSIGIEKMKKIFEKRYETKNRKRAVIRFYDEYFTVTGIGSISEYAYKQVTEIRAFREFIFLYTGSEQAVYLAKDGFSEGTADEFIKYVKERMYSSKDNVDIKE